ncbi:hypothetical protein BDN71DRAFT_1393026, partial [Pleurotus eryngii]
YKGDKFLANIAANPRHYKNFTVKNGLITLCDNRQEILCVPDIVINGSNVCEIVINKVHSMLAQYTE